MEMLQQQGFRVAHDCGTPGVAFCGAIPVDNWMISPQGFLSKCVTYVDRAEESLGKLHLDGTISLNSNAATWLNFLLFFASRNSPLLQNIFPGTGGEN
jgi:hypothetical protein